MGHMLSYPLITLGVVGLTTAILDVFLSDQHKAALANGLTRVWYWLDEMRKPSFVRWVHRLWPQRVLIGFSLLLGIGVTYAAVDISKHFVAQFPMSELFSSDEREPKTEWTTFGTIVLFGMSFLVALVGIGIGLWVIRRKATSYYVHAIIPVTWAVDQYSSSYLVDAMNELERNTLLSFLAHLYFSNLIAIVFLMWLIVFLPLAFALIASGLLATLELCVRKLVEYPKGPIMALNGLSVVAGAFLRLVLGK
jgi:hypothetical protein